MDGIELVRKIRELTKPIEIIILSCYNDFHYVKEALKLGACDYLFKLDMLSGDILKALQKAVERIKNREETYNRIKSLEKTISDNINIAKEAFLFDIINGKKVSCELFSKTAEKLGIKLNYNDLSLSIIKIDDIVEATQNGFFGDDYIAKILIMNSIRDTLSECDKAEVVFRSKDEYILLMNFHKENSEKRRHDCCNKFLTKVINNLGNEFQLRVTVGTSKKLWKIENLKDAFKESSCAVDNRYFEGTGRVIYYKELDKQKEISNVKISNMLHELMSCENEEYEKSIKEVFNRIRLRSNFNMKDVIEVGSYIIGVLLKSVSGQETVIEEIYNSEPYIYSSLNKINTIDEIEAFICRIAVKIEDLLEKRYRDEVGQALKYIETNLEKSDLSLGEVAEFVNLSKNYFSRVFKKNLGMNFIDYLINARLDKSEELYKTTRLKVYQIADKVGYSDWRYFCKIYKKRKGRNLTSLKK